MDDFQPMPSIGQPGTPLGAGSGNRPAIGVIDEVNLMVDGISFLAEVVGGQQKITKVLPKLGK